MIIVNPEPTFDRLEDALRRARKDEALSEEPRYVLVYESGGYQVIRRKPLGGTWFTSDGTQHG